MTNMLARLSKAKYLAKCDAHTLYDEGFDVKLMDAMEGHDDWTVVPIMRNLHAFDWKCMKCGNRWYQGPTPNSERELKKNGGVACRTRINREESRLNPDCDNVTNFTRRLVWEGKPSPQSTAYCFDPEPHFQYMNSMKKRPEGQGEITPTMSLQGSFFMLSRDKYWELNICDEAFGSWGSQGIEVACKTWLSGGQVMCVQTTWYAHMFRTQGGDFSFPYEQKQSKVNEAKAKARDTFFNGKWDKQIHPVSWLVRRFWPVDHWQESDLQKLKQDEAK